MLNSDLAVGRWTAPQGSVKVVDNMFCMWFTYKGGLFDAHLSTVRFTFDPQPEGDGFDYRERDIYMASWSLIAWRL